MKRILLGAALALLTYPATADTLTIAAGKMGGGYDARARIIEQRLDQRGLDAAVENMNGSDEISLAVCAGRAQLGIMQIDALYARALEGCTVKPVAVFGNEYAFLLLPPKSDLDELSDFGPQNGILVDTIGSGSDLFWRTIVKIETGDDGDSDEWASARIVNDPLDLANASASMGDISAVVIVRKLESPDVTRLLDMGWTIGEMWDRDIDDLQFNGQPLYASEYVKVLFGNGTTKGYAYQVRSLIVTTQQVAQGDRKLFSAITSATQ